MAARPQQPVVRELTRGRNILDLIRANLLAADASVHDIVGKSDHFVDKKSCLHIENTSIVFYDHLSQVMTTLLDERPINAVDIIEDISKKVKRTQFSKKMDTLRDEYENSMAYSLAEVQKSLFVKAIETEEGAAVDHEEEV
eukprot:g34807.t1